MPNPALLVVGALFFIALAALLYVAAWGIVSATLVLWGRQMSFPAQKRLLLALLILPPVAALMATVGGVLFRHIHTMSLGGHHHALCQALFLQVFAWKGVGGGAVSSLIIGGLAWFFLFTGLFFVARLIWATMRLERGISPFLETPSPNLTASLLHIVGGDPRRLAFFECDVAARYSSVIGLWKPRCVLSKSFVAHATDEERDAVVAHELAHMRASDALTGLLVGVVTCFFFYLRPVGLLARRWREAAELAADDAAATLTRNPLAVASALLNAQAESVSWSTGAPLPLTTPGFSQDVACPASLRIARLLDRVEHSQMPITESRRETIWGWAGTLAFAGIILLLLTSQDAACLAHCSLEALQNLVS